MKLLRFVRNALLLALSIVGSVWAQRTVSLTVTGNQITGAGTAAVVLASQGDENAIGFSVTFNPAVLRFDSHVAGSDSAGATINLNDTQRAAGNVGFGIALPANAKFGAGARQLVVLNFTVLTPSVAATIGFGNSPILREISDVAANELTAVFSGLTIAVNLPPVAPAFTSQPAVQNVTSGQNATFTVAATGNPAPTFVWQKSIDAGANWTDLTNAGRVTGATSPTLTITGALSTDAASYRAVATNGVGSPANSAAATLTVNKANQTITFGALAPTSFGAGQITLNASASSGLPVSYTSSNPAAALVSGNTITVGAVGSAIITANQVGNSEFNAATDVPQTLVVGKASASVSLAGLTQTYNGSPRAVTATTNPTGLTVTITYDGTPTPPINVGTYAVVATINDANYAGSSTGSLVVSKADQLITFAALSQVTFNGADFTLSATTSSTLGVTFASSNSAVATVTGNTVSIKGAGTATITATQIGNGNFNAAPPVPQSLTVNKAVATVTLGSLAATYDRTPKAATAITAPVGRTVTFT